MPPKLKKKIILTYEVAYQRAVSLLRWFELRGFYRLRIMSSVQTLKYIQKHKCSVARFGDGEFSIMINSNHSIGFQTGSQQLVQRLCDVLKSKNPNLLLCIPRYFVSLRGCTQECQSFWWVWGQTEHRQKKIVKKIRHYAGRRYRFGDALISRPYMDLQSIPYATKIFNLITEIWRDRDVLIVEGDQTRLGIGNDLLDGCRSIKRILAPSIGAFASYEKIVDTVVNKYNGELVVTALGPTATVLAADLTELDIQVLDIGHIDIEYEWFLNRATTKEAVKGKFTNENMDGLTHADCNDANYLSQIIARVE